jgi:SAM-dependent methyltransferase
MPRSFDPQNSAEFDRHAESYDAEHQKSIRASGEDPEYFAQYKLRCMERVLGAHFGAPVLDFGCGIGNLTHLLVRSFPDVSGYDPSIESVKAARARSPGCSFYDNVEALPTGHYGAAVLANVLHHVPVAERRGLIATIARALAPGGKLIVFEHNPMNPVTRRAVAACSFDEDAVLLYPWEVKRLLRDAGLTRVTLDYIVFFPRVLAMLRPLEPRLAWLPGGAQVVAHATKV